MENVSGERTGPPDWQWFAFTLVASLFILLPMLALPFGFDQGIQHYLAWAMLRGEWLYVQAWDTSFPGGPLVHAMAIVTGGNSVLAVRVVDLILELAIAAALFVAGRRMAGPRAGMFAALTYMIAYRAGGYYSTAQRDGFLVLPLVLGLLAFWRFLERGRRSSLVLAAVAIGLAALIRPTYALVAVAGAVYLLVREIRTGHSARRGLLDAALFGLVSAAPILLFFLIYAISGRFGAVRQLLLADATIYPLLERETPRRIVIEMVRFVPWLLLAGAGIAFLTRRAAGRARTATNLLVVTCILCFAIRLWESKAYRYQFWPLIACLALLAGAGWVTAIERLFAKASATTSARAPARWRFAAGTLFLLALLGAQYFRALGIPMGYRSLGARLHREPSDVATFGSFLSQHQTQSEVAKYLHDHAAPGAAVQLWGPMTGVLVAAGLPSATRFTDPFLMFCAARGSLQIFELCPPAAGTPLQRAFRDEIVTHLKTEPPLFIVAHYANGSLAIHEGPCLAPDLPELRAILDSGYVREETFGNWSVFRRR
jgi:hypothetical protein